MTEVWHLAAATTFDERKAPELSNVNVGGTRRLLALLGKSRRLDNFYFTSTAYIVGADRVVSPEDELPPVRAFNNTYEASKWQAEKLVRESGLPFTIFRPSILLDRSDGRCEGDGRMMYGYLLGVTCALARHFREHDVKFKEHLADGGWLECDFRLVGHNSVTKNFGTVRAARHPPVAAALPRNLSALRAPRRGGVARRRRPSAEELTRSAKADPARRSAVRGGGRVRSAPNSVIGITWFGAGR